MALKFPRGKLDWALIVLLGAIIALGVTRLRDSDSPPAADSPEAVLATASKAASSSAAGTPDELETAPISEKVIALDLPKEKTTEGDAPKIRSKLRPNEVEPKEADGPKQYGLFTDLKTHPRPDLDPRDVVKAEIVAEFDSIESARWIRYNSDNLRDPENLNTPALSQMIEEEGNEALRVLAEQLFYPDLTEDDKILIISQIAQSGKNLRPVLNDLQRAVNASGLPSSVKLNAFKLLAHRRPEVIATHVNHPDEVVAKEAVLLQTLDEAGIPR